MRMILTDQARFLLFNFEYQRNTVQQQVFVNGFKELRCNTRTGFHLVWFCDRPVCFPHPDTFDSLLQGVDDFPGSQRIPPDCRRATPMSQGCRRSNPYVGYLVREKITWEILRKSVGLQG